MPRYKSGTPAPKAIGRIRLFGCRPGHGFERSYAEAEGNNLARYLTGLPPNELTPAHYRRRVAALAKTEGWRMEFLDQKTLRRIGAGAFLAVAQGSPEPDAGIIHLEFRPRRARRRAAVALVGKGICFDTGGVNLKPASFMLGMHKDMQGSAVALGTLLALTRLEVGFPVECWMALATNHIGPRAYKPNDIVKAADGTTIEVINTDAEGRMVLADTLALASRTGPRLVIDFATLTGACKRALGNGYSGAFSNRDRYLSMLIEAGRACGERVWPFPLDADYDEALESTVADIKQCAEEAGADHILAARFLRRFVKAEIPWIHVDLSSGTRKGGLAHVPTDITGFGVRLALHLLLDRGLAEGDGAGRSADDGPERPMPEKGKARGAGARSRRANA
jgi:leucyl aminopeptidase